jgi:hypothetical protein
MENSGNYEFARFDYLLQYIAKKHDFVMWRKTAEYLKFSLPGGTI